MSLSNNQIKATAEAIGKAQWDQTAEEGRMDLLQIVAPIAVANGLSIEMMENAYNDTLPDMDLIDKADSMLDSTSKLTEIATDLITILRGVETTSFRNAGSNRLMASVADMLVVATPEQRDNGELVVKGFSIYTDKDGDVFRRNAANRLDENLDVSRLVWEGPSNLYNNDEDNTEEDDSEVEDDQ